MDPDEEGKNEFFGGLIQKAKTHQHTANNRNFMENYPDRAA